MLLRVSDRIGRRAVLVAMDDASAIHAAAHAPLLADRFLLPEQPGALPGRLADKAELAGLCADAGIAHPDTVVPETAHQAAEAVRRLGLPLVAKWSRPWLLTAATGLRSTTLVRSPAEARALYARSEIAGSRLLLQRHLADGPDTDWFFHGYFSADSACLLGGSGRKELSWPVRTGLTAVGRWQLNPEVEEAAQRLVSHVGYRGILDLDFRREGPAGPYQLLDVNPRPGAQFRLFTDSGGLDVVRSLYLDLTGQSVPRQVGRPGRLFVAENYALLSAAVSVRHRLPPAGPRPDSPQEGVETAWFAGDDMRPFFAMTRAWLGRGLAKSANRVRAVVGPRTPTVTGVPPRPRGPADAGASSPAPLP